MANNKNVPKITIRLNKRQSIIALSIIALILLAPTVFLLSYIERVYPNVKVAGIAVGGKKLDEIATDLSSQISPAKEVKIRADNEEYKIPVETFSLKYDFEKTADKAYKLGRSGNFFFDMRTIINSMFWSKNLGVELTLDEESLYKHLTVVSGGVSVDPVYPTVNLVDNKVIVNKGKIGSQIDFRKARVDIGQKLTYLEDPTVMIEKKIVDPTLSPSQEKEYYNRANTLKDKTVIVSFENEEFTYHGEELLKLLGPYGGYDKEKILAVSVKIAQALNRDPQNPTFVFEEGRVQEFAPSKEGIRVKTEELLGEFEKNIERLEKEETSEITFTPPVETTKSEINTEEVNNLGIKELVGRGESHYRGSISSRLHNISLATSRLNGQLIKPGETFSFNNALGDVSKLTGYQEAYVIKDGKTVLGDGGGVCQVSTTFFRAAMNAGLPITERRAHSYRVGYYEQDAGPGLDATVYSPTTDLKVVNNTSGHILIQAKADHKNYTLVFELYGTSDGRQATVTKPVILSTSAPPDDLYIDDPTLPIGVIKQVERRIPGAKTSFDYFVTRDGQEIYRKTFISVYRPWQAVYLRGTAPN